eukprot:TRINITY_DN12616_c0_g1_i1.p2 TRINITY_DN12616_c0_g1~~TRINITY_DN12616_c0_g1_i1.p2  ORF type:complete len:122 (-),score=7.87 TRINITY_DN12616_c0_g1_i1:22-387(-)
MNDVHGCSEVETFFGAFHQQNQVSRANEGVQEKGSDCAPPRAAEVGHRKQRRVEEILERKTGQVRANEDPQQSAKAEVVEALNAANLSDNQPRIPHRCPVKHAACACDATPPCFAVRLTRP